MTTVSTANEAQLIAQLQKGDRNAFSELVRVYARGVLNVVHHMCGEMLIAEDAPGTLHPCVAKAHQLSPADASPQLVVSHRLQRQDG